MAGQQAAMLLRPAVVSIWIAVGITVGVLLTVVSGGIAPFTPLAPLLSRVWVGIAVHVVLCAVVVIAVGIRLATVVALSHSSIPINVRLYVCLRPST